MFLLVMVLVVGGVKGGARLSFDIGPIAVQPSEIAKVTTLLMLAGFLADADTDKVSYERLIQSLFIVGAPAFLVLIEPDLGSASVLVACAMGVLLVAGAELKYIAFITGMGVISAVAGVLSGVVKTYQLRRITAFLQQNSDSADLQNLVTQVRFAKRAVATGGFFGKGTCRGPSRTAGSSRSSRPTSCSRPSGSSSGWWAAPWCWPSSPWSCGASSGSPGWPPSGSGRSSAPGSSR